ncbi:hypothetical protein BJ508DRAFT_410665 [Ascobolus immersus RN42]|uniref:Uncharacterized protein n=1 Tax=Ascobolus immersus RN42 TaxID=1160509 RepID=A0A3N4ISB8_ASCIM|nr:hypothetical protein BJ508DRAFT_410665 [Ascobolus immersus RN42]
MDFSPQHCEMTSSTHQSTTNPLPLETGLDSLFASKLTISVKPPQAPPPGKASRSNGTMDFSRRQDCEMTSSTDQPANAIPSSATNETGLETLFSSKLNISANQAPPRRASIITTRERENRTRCTKSSQKQAPRAIPGTNACGKRSNDIFGSGSISGARRPPQTLHNKQTTTSTVQWKTAKKATTPPDSNLPQLQLQIRRILGCIQLIFRESMAEAAATTRANGDVWVCPTLGAVDVVWGELEEELSWFKQQTDAIKLESLPLYDEDCREQLKELMCKYRRTLRLYNGFRMMRIILSVIRVDARLRRVFQDANVQIPENFADVERLLVGGLQSG